MKRGLVLLAVVFITCGEDKPPVPPPPGGGFQIRGPVLVAPGANTYPIAIEEETFKVAYSSDDLFFIRELVSETTLASGEKIDRAFPPIFDLAWSRAAFVRAFDGNQDYELAAADFAAAEKMELTTNGRTPLVTSGDGSKLLYLSQGAGIPELWSYDLSTKSKRMLAAQANRLHVINGSTKVVYTVPGELHVVDVLSGEDVRAADFQAMAHAGPGAAKLLIYTAPQTLQMFDALTGRLDMLATDASEEVGNAEISADQTRGIFAREEITGRALYHFETANPMPVKIFAYTEEARIAPDGRSVLLWTYRGPANLFLWKENDPMRDPPPLNRFFVPSGGPRYDEQMKYIAYFSRPDPALGNYELHFYDAAVRRDTIIHDNADTGNMRIANDGSRVAYYRGDDPNYGPLAVWERATTSTVALSPRATRQLVAKKDLSAIVFSEAPTADRVSLWTLGASSASVIAERGGLANVRFDPSGQKIAFEKDGDLWIDVLSDTGPATLLAKDAGEGSVLAESLIAYAVRAGTSTASGVYIAPLP